MYSRALKNKALRAEVFPCSSLRVLKSVQLATGDNYRNVHLRLRSEVRLPPRNNRGTVTGVAATACLLRPHAPTGLLSQGFLTKLGAHFLFLVFALRAPRDTSAAYCDGASDLVCAVPVAKGRRKFFAIPCEELHACLFIS